MEFRRLDISDVVLFVPHRFVDDRGWLAETWSARLLAEAGFDLRFVQDNHSFSEKRGTVRALHFQRPPHEQAKLVRVVRGAAYDVALDLRRSSPTYGRFASATLTAEGGEQMLIPAGFAHGFATLAPATEVLYKLNQPYAPEAESGILWSDPDLAIPWPVKPEAAILSEKDRKLPRFAGFESPFRFGGR